MDLLLKDNPYFTAGFGLIGVGAIAAGARGSIIKATALLQRRYITTLEITSRDPSYRWFTHWINRHADKSISGSHSTLVSSHDGRQISLIPSPGVHYFSWQRNWFRMERTRDRSTGVEAIGGLFPFETVTLSCWGKGSPAMCSLIKEVMATGHEEDYNKLQVWSAFAAEWRPFGQPKRKRPLESVTLKSGQIEAIVKDIQAFQSSNEWYFERGIPYRRGYLLHGPPGCGKSSFIHALASKLDYGLAVMSLAELSLSDDRLAHLMSNLPSKTLLLLEDIDAALPPRDAAIPKHSNVTLSGLLNAIDGVMAAEERIIFMTTNHFDRLDPALIRPGRIDMMMHVDCADGQQAEQMFNRFYPGSPDMASAFGSAVSKKALSPATIQGIFIMHKDDPHAALRKVMQ